VHCVPDTGYENDNPERRYYERRDDHHRAHHIPSEKGLSLTKAAGGRQSPPKQLAPRLWQKLRLTPAAASQPTLGRPTEI
jgi:hypothetical protein